MNEQNNFALVTKPPSALERIQPGTRRILSDMVTDTLALVRSDDAVTLYQRGCAYRDGNGVRQDFTEAIKWFRKAAEQGCADAQFALAECCENGWGIEEDPDEAVQWYRQAAEQGHAESQCSLASTLEDPDEAAKWYRKAAEQGNRAAQWHLGLCYKHGEGVAIEATEAVKWFHKAAEQGSIEGQDFLGGCYRDGQGVAKNYEEAAKWFRRAAEQGDAYAQFDLGTCYDKGNGVAMDAIEAYKWYQLAATNRIGLATYKNEALEQAKRALEERITPEERAEAERRVREFHPLRTQNK